MCWKIFVDDALYQFSVQLKQNINLSIRYLTKLNT